MNNFIRNFPIPEWLTIKVKICSKITKYTYAEPKKGTKAGVVLPIISYTFKTGKVALLHTHGSYLEDYGVGNDIFSKADKRVADVLDLPFYLVTPLGTMRKYVPATGEDILLYDDLPYDINHPRR